MRIRHEQLTVADHGFAAATGSATMNGTVLAEAITVPDLEDRVLTNELQILRIESDACKWEYSIVLAKRSWALDLSTCANRSSLP
jgi:hypothetical protein